MVVKTIKLTSLFVNTENYRFEPLSSQKEAIDKMVEDQGDKLYSLVDDIVTNGLSPVDLIIVTPNEDNNKYIVLEGNFCISHHTQNCLSCNHLLQARTPSTISRHADHNLSIAASLSLPSTDKTIDC